MGLNNVMMLHHVLFIISCTFDKYVFVFQSENILITQFTFFFQKTMFCMVFSDDY